MTDNNKILLQLVIGETTISKPLSYSDIVLIVKEFNLKNKTNNLIVPHPTEPSNIKQKKKDYYQNFLNKHDNNKVQCECGGNYTYFSKSTHLKSGKHQKHILKI